MHLISFINCINSNKSHTTSNQRAVLFDLFRYCRFLQWGQHAFKGLTLNTAAVIMASGRHFVSACSSIQR